jgi:hypothetical protein
VSDDLSPAHAAVLALPPVERYQHLLERCAATERLWGLRDEEGWAMVGDAEGGVFFPVWPERELAEVCATGEWEQYGPSAIPLVEWLNAWLPNLAGEGWGVAVFPGPQGDGVHASADELRVDLERALRPS